MPFLGAALLEATTSLRSSQPLPSCSHSFQSLLPSYPRSTAACVVTASGSGRLKTTLSRRRGSTTYSVCSTSMPWQSCALCSRNWPASSPGLASRGRKVYDLVRKKKSTSLVGHVLPSNDWQVTSKG